MVATSMGEKSSVPLHIVLCSIISPKILQEGLSVCAFGLGIPPWLFYEKGLSQGKKKEKEKVKTEAVPRTSWNRKHAGGF